MATLHALLLTDVVDSTRLTEQLDETAATALWSAHDRLARDLIPRWRGREIDKTDGMLLLFDTVADAVGYALAYHQALRVGGLTIRARAGIHFGPVSLRANPAEDVARGAKPVEVDGIALPMVARIMSIANGGQTLLSEDARTALGTLPLRIQSHGHWLLHGIARPIELFEIADDDGSFFAPSDGAKAYRVVRQGDLWQPLRDIRHSLPAERDPFVGRQQILQDLAKQLDGGGRLISVLGVGGVGKTRLVTRFAWTRRAECPGGVWFCDLSQARDVDGILFAVAQGLEVPLGTDPVLQLGQAIASRGKCLVILDNFEQVAKFAEETLGRWLERSPLAQFVVTTREVLGIVGEQILALPPLDREEAVELFLKRADAARKGYGQGADDRNVIAQLVNVLDCLPLAIELAAARVRVMTPRSLLVRMKDRFDVLLSHAGRRDRQATLRAAFDWSWELLNEPEKATLARLSIFEGGFTVESANVVAAVGSATNAAPPMFDLIQSLVDKSFIREIGEERFDLLESVREYAAQHLRTPGRFDQSGPACAAQTRSRHWRYFAGIDEQLAVAGRCVELNNSVAACRAASAEKDGTSAPGCLVSAWHALRIAGPFRLGVELAGTVSSIGSLSDREQSRVHWVSANALDLLGEIDAARLQVRQGLASAARADDAEYTSRLLIVLGGRQTLDGDFEAAFTSLTQADAFSEKLGNRTLQSETLNYLGRLMSHQSRFSEARDYYEKSLALARAGGDRRQEGGLLGNLGAIQLAMGELDQARQHYEQALAIASATGDRRWEGNHRCNLGLIYQEQGKNNEARAQFDLSLNTAREAGHARLAYIVLCNLGILLTAEGRFDEAVKHLEDAVIGAVGSSDRRSEGQFRGYLAVALAGQRRFAEARVMLAAGEELLVALGDRLSYGLLLCDLAEVESLAGDEAASGAAMRQARHIAEELGCAPDSQLYRRIAALEAARCAL
jgi:predicted ATPase/class 3 adenylate cyclase